MIATVDSSRRYVLRADDPYLANLAALWASDPALAREIEAIEESASDLVIERSRSGAPTLVAQTAAGRSITLHSKYDPVAEARKLMEQVKTEHCVAFYLLGLGLGYGLEAL